VPIADRCPYLVSLSSVSLMPTKVIQYDNATITIHAPIFGADTVDVLFTPPTGVGKHAVGLTVDEFAALIYPAIQAWADGRLR
jgi:hypothetical protein